MRLNASSSKAREAVVLLVVVDVDEMKMDSVVGEKVEVNEPLAEWIT